MVILKELQSVLMPTCFVPISKEVFDRNRAGNTGVVGSRGRGGGHGAATFLQAKRKKENKGKKRKTFKAETIKRLSPSSKCYCFSHSRASRIQNFFLSPNHGGRLYLSVFHGPSTLKSISPALNTYSTNSKNSRSGNAWTFILEGKIVYKINCFYLNYTFLLDNSILWQIFHWMYSTNNLHIIGLRKLSEET